VVLEPSPTRSGGEGPLDGQRAARVRKTCSVTCLTGGKTIKEYPATSAGSPEERAPVGRAACAGIAGEFDAIQEGRFGCAYRIL
jgi:hypothetical protein